jgi:phage gp16-like protein
VTLGEKIRAVRLEQKLTQEQLGGQDFTKVIAAMEKSCLVQACAALHGIPFH